MRRHLSLLALACSLLALGACASTSSRLPVQSVSIFTRTTFMVCTGVCPNYSLTVWSDGRVLVARHFTGDRDEVRRYRVSRAEAAQFANILLPYRATAPSVGPTSCRHSEPGNGPQFVMSGADTEISWADEPHDARLGFCRFAPDDRLAETYNGPRFTPQIREAITHALWSIGLYVDATRRE